MIIVMKSRIVAWFVEAFLVTFLVIPAVGRGHEGSEQQPGRRDDLTTDIPHINFGCEFL